MIIARIKLNNWRNFRTADACLRRTSYVLGPNASGKSNLLDAFRFLRDICSTDGGGLQKAVKDRGGIRKLRCLGHGQDPDVRIEVHLADDFGSPDPTWRYLLGFKPESASAQGVVITAEEIWKKARCQLRRPKLEDKQDPRQLTTTYMEQTLANRDFRDVVDEFAEIAYLHLVPQLLKYNDIIGGKRLEHDPYGQGLLERIARTNSRTRKWRLNGIGKALSLAIPGFRELKLGRDDLGHPHLRALYEHDRPDLGWQQEEQFSDGTLRLLALLWSLLEGDGLLLLEEPELSLNAAVVEQIPFMIDSVQQHKGSRRQVLISTHSESVLSNKGIDARGVVMLVPGREGATTRAIDSFERAGLDAGFSVGEVVLPQTRPPQVERIRLFE